MRISASLYAFKGVTLKSCVEKLDAFGVDMFHIDFDDSKMNLAQLVHDVDLIRSLSDTPIDLHIISPSPSQYFNLIEKKKIESVCFQYENLAEKLILPKNAYSKFGLSIITSTPSDVYFQAESVFDYLLFMTSSPGESGGSFKLENINRINRIKEENPNVPIRVDGGLCQPILNKIDLEKIDVVVLGSMLSKAKNLEKTINELKAEKIVY